MENEFEIEKQNMKVKIKLSNPTRKDAKEYRKQAIELHNLAKSVQDGDIEGQLKIQEKLDQMMLGMIIKLNKQEVFKTVDDFDEVTNSDMNKLYGWLTGKMKVSFDEGFLPK